MVITSANEEDITHSIFYTAITRARENLRIYWSPETQQTVISALRSAHSNKDAALLSACPTGPCSASTYAPRPPPGVGFRSVTR